MNVSLAVLLVRDTAEIEPVTGMCN